MKMNIEIIEKRMYPGNWTSNGFLLLGQSLSRIIKEDKETLQRLGSSAQELGSLLFNMIEGDFTDEEHNRYRDYDIEVTRVPGLSFCPWINEEFTVCNEGQGQKHLSYMLFKVTNKKTGNTVSSNSLMIHLIRDHAFFGGPGSNVRIDPEKLYFLLEGLLGKPI